MFGLGQQFVERQSNGIVECIRIIVRELLVVGCEWLVIDSLR